MGLFLIFLKRLFLFFGKKIFEKENYLSFSKLFF
ncbi:hypothetical protein M8044_000135 [Columbia Basin potato purple top phytoplasma]|uniref:Uncharacterized protein n=1 Tax=Columbia Basin potato purple top phytoplasma TaxID=307134 RepID=A0ABT5L8B6_9MOLU|nr:hypothetical protein [Columbia Basin potato purple top phytoplasma]